MLPLYIGAWFNHRGLHLPMKHRRHGGRNSDLERRHRGFDLEGVETSIGFHRKDAKGAKVVSL
jgi:hypothetical protein